MAKLEAYEQMDVDFEGPGSMEIASGLTSLFFATMFSPIDGLFILFAVGTAFKLGSGEMTD